MVDDRNDETPDDEHAAESRAPDADDADDEWRFSLADLEDDGEEEEEVEGFSLYGEIEVGSPSAEHALFVGLGLALGIFVGLQLFL